MATEAGDESTIPLVNIGSGYSEQADSTKRQESVDNELAVDHIYAQRFGFAASETEQFKKSVDSYIQKMLNHLGIIFFKAQTYYSDAEDAATHCVIEFHLFSIECLGEDDTAKIVKRVDKFLNKFNGQAVRLISSDVLVRTQTELRKPVYTRKHKDIPDNPEEPIRSPDEDDSSDEDEPVNEQDPEPDPELDPDFCQLNWSCFRKCIEWWLVVPRVQWDFFALLYQMYTFDIFHQGFLPKFVHFFTIPVNVALSMMFLAQFELGNLDKTTVYGSEFLFDINGSFILMMILVVLYSIMGLIRRCPVWGFATSFLIFLLWGVGNCMYTKFRYETRYYYSDNDTDLDTSPKWYNPVLTPYNPIMWSYIMSFIQASSHIFVPQMPPFITGVTHWESVSFFLFRQKGAKACFWRMLALGAFPVTSVAVAWFSWPHLIGTEVFYIMAGIGYKPCDFEKYKLITEKAELSGNPIISRFPDSFRDLTEAFNVEHNIKHKCKAKLEKHGLLEPNKHYTPKDVSKELASLHIYQRYFHNQQHIGDPKKNDKAKVHFLHFKALTDSK